MTVQLFEGDCLDYLATLSDASIDAIVTDPPYGVNYQSAKRTDKATWKPKIANDTLPFTTWLDEAYRVTKPTGSLVCFHRWDVQEEFRLAIVKAGYTIKSQVIWDKQVHGMGDLTGAFAPCHENAWFATKHSFKFWHDRPKSILSIMRIPAEQLLHPNEKPVALFATLIEALVASGGNVLDCFAGVGGCGIAAVRLARNFYCCELDHKYFTIMQQRIQAAQDQLTLF